jgi:hypothetical protein
MAAKRHDVDSSHSGRKIAKNPDESKGVWRASGLALFLDGILKATDNMRLQRHGKGGNGCQEKKR